MVYEIYETDTFLKLYDVLEKEEQLWMKRIAIKTKYFKRGRYTNFIWNKK